MKVIQFQDKDAKDLLSRLELAKFHVRTPIHKGECLPDDATKRMAEEVHRQFHYHVVNWLQEQGASTL